MYAAALTCALAFQANRLVVWDLTTSMTHDSKRFFKQEVWNRNCFALVSILKCSTAENIQGGFRFFCAFIFH